VAVLVNSSDSYTLLGTLPLDMGELEERSHEEQAAEGVMLMER
jgi:hypothetical protein